MEKGNVLVIGNSGVGKSTLINAVLGEDCAVTGYGTEGTTKELKIYENDKVQFRLIDTIGFEPTFFREMQAINAVKKWSKESANPEAPEKTISAIWFCVDGTSRKLFSKTVDNLCRATSIWKSVPIIVVITKSFSLPDRAENIEMVYQAFAKQKGKGRNVKKVVPVVASTYVLNESAYAPPEGIEELIDITNSILPEGMRAAERDVAEFILARKRVLAHGFTAVATTSAAVVGAVPIPFSDAVILAPVEMMMLNGLAKIYGVNKNEKSKAMFESIVQVGTVGVAAKMAISALKAIPVINVGASAINAVVGASIVAALGEGSIYVFEQIYLGHKTVEDIDWMTKVMESEFSSKFVETISKIAQQINSNMDGKTLAKVVLDAFSHK